MLISESELDRLRQEADPLADHCIRELFQNNQVDAVNRTLDALSRNDSALPDDLPPVLKNYLDRSATLPADFDAARFQRAEEAFVLHGPAMGIALMYASLPTLYAGAMGGVQLLAMTGQLQRNYRRRAAETLRFILDCMEPGGFAGSGKGIRAVQKVRLIHATIRFFAMTTGKWAALPTWGAPLNQEELVGTLLGFSVVAIDNAKKLGAPLTDSQAEDLLYAWRIIGNQLGIVPEAMPQSIPAARELWKLIGQRNFRPTPDGARLATDHIAFLDELVPETALDGVNLALSRWLMGPYVAETCLQLARPPLWTRLLRLLLPAVGFVDCFVESWSPITRMTQHINVALMESLDRWWAQGGSPQFRIPTAMGPQGTVAAE